MCLEDWLAHVEVRLKVMHLHENALLSLRLAHDVEAPATLFHHIKHHEVKRWVTALAILGLFGSATKVCALAFRHPSCFRAASSAVGTLMYRTLIHIMQV